MIKITDLSHEIIELNNPINCAVDMTAGLGNDTIFLSKISKKVYAFDIQKMALEKTNELLKLNKINNVTLINDDHQFIQNYIDELIDLAIYNLGYLPNSSKEIRTETTSTLKSLIILLEKLTINGQIVIVLYPHNKEEVIEVENYCMSLNNDFDVLKYQIINKTNAPFIIKIKKMRSSL
ncbi:MAG: class I SAM-dependent methyltransferase [Candidatus Izemoplasmatales bacterium]|nr:class I SAM-dependent methyltransferase [Candidatus Izemoplasmatales bacterium]